MDQDQLNKELDHLLEELIFNEDISSNDDPAEMKRILLSLVYDRNNHYAPVEVSDEQWRNYCVHCIQTTVENAQSQEVRKQLVQ